MRTPWQLTVWLILVVVCPHLVAQEGIIIDDEELDDYQRILFLTNDQRTIINTLLDGYEREIKRLRDEIAHANKQMNDESHALDEADRTLERLMEIQLRTMRRIHEVATQVFATNDQFLDDVRMILHDDQVGQWPRIERTRRRHSFLDQGELPGAMTDLNQVLAKIDAPSSRDLADLQLDYEQKLDALMLERQAQFEITLAQLADGVVVRSSLDALTPDEQAAIDELETDKHETDMELIELNSRYADRLARLLAPDLAAAFKRHVLQATCDAHLRRDRIVQTIFDRAAGLSTIDDDQRAAITSLRDRHVASARDADLAQALAMVDHIIISHAAEQGDASADHVTDSFDHWNEARLEYEGIVERCLARLRTELTATQIAEAGWTELFDENAYAKWHAHIRSRQNDR